MMSFSLQHTSFVNCPDNPHPSHLSLTLTVTFPPSVFQIFSQQCHAHAVLTPTNAARKRLVGFNPTSRWKAYALVSKSSCLRAGRPHPIIYNNNNLTFQPFSFRKHYPKTCSLDLVQYPLSSARMSH